MGTIVDPDRLDHQAGGWGIEDGEQGCLERQQRLAVAGGAFGEDGEAPAIGQRLGDAGDLDGDRFAVAARDIDGVVEAAHPADERHVLKIVLGDEGGAGRARQQGNIEPADVIGDEEGVLFERGADRLPPRARDAAERAQEQPRPGRWQAEQPPEAVQRHRDNHREDEARDPEIGARVDCRVGGGRGGGQPISPCGRWRRRTAPSGDRPGGSPGVRRSAFAAVPVRDRQIR